MKLTKKVIKEAIEEALNEAPGPGEYGYAGVDYLELGIEDRIFIVKGYDPDDPYGHHAEVSIAVLSKEKVPQVEELLRSKGLEPDVNTIRLVK